MKNIRSWSFTWMPNRGVELSASGKLHQQGEDGGTTTTARLQGNGTWVDLVGRKIN